MQSFYRRSRAGTRATCTTTTVRSKNYSVVAAMSSSSLFHFSIYNDSITGDTFSHYVEELIGYVRNENSEPAFIIIQKPEADISSALFPLNICLRSGKRR